jgi:hypothetical protein
MKTSYKLLLATRAFTANRQPMTILVGNLKDQAALAGVSNALYDLQTSGEYDGR